MQKFRFWHYYFLIFLFLFHQSVFCQYLGFGRNKVQYDDFDWHSLNTEHFKIFYYPEIQEIAEIGAAIAEKSYFEYRIKFNFQINQQIPLIFYNTHNHFQQTNILPQLIPEGVGGFFEFIKGRVVIPFDGSIKEFEHVIRHELIHVFMTTKIMRIQKDFRLTKDFVFPLWFTEGLAEYLSTAWDTRAEMILRDAVLNNYFSDLSDIENYYGSYLMYKFGQKVLQVFSEIYGKEKIMELFDNIGYVSDFNELLEYTLNNKFEEINLKINSYLKKEYYPIVNSEYFINEKATQISFEGFNLFPCIYSKADTNLLIYFNNNYGYSSIIKRDLNKTSEDDEIILKGENTEEFESLHFFKNNLTVNNKGIIAFVSKVRNKDEIKIIDLNGKLIKSYSFDDIVSIRFINWSNEGDKLAFSAVNKKGFCDIYILEIDSGLLLQLTNDYYFDSNPVFAFDDKYLIFSSDRLGNMNSCKLNLFLFNINSKEFYNITNLSQNCFNPVYDKLNNRILFITEFNAVNAIAELNFVKSESNIVFDTCIILRSNLINSVNSFCLGENGSIYFDSYNKKQFNIFQLDKFNKLYDTLYFENRNNTFWIADKLTDNSIRQKYNYQKEYTLDFAASQITTNPVYGTSGGAIFSLSDLFGDDQYLFYIFNNAQTSSDLLESFNVSISKLDLKSRINYAFGVFHFSGRRYDIRDSDEYYYEKIYGADLSLLYPLSIFRRIEFNFSAASSDKEVFRFYKDRKAFLLSGNISYTFDNSLWSYTGPIDGMRYSILCGITNDIKYSNVNYYSLMLDFRKYFRLGITSALAFRIQYYMNSGKEARRYFMGGSWDLRGWDRWSIRGEKQWLSSLELRFPLIDKIQIKMPVVDLNFYGFRGALFFDVGSSWDKNYNTTFGSIGGGLRINLFNVVVLRYDIGKKIENNFQNFQKSFFYQFFFGWDF